MHHRSAALLACLCAVVSLAPSAATADEQSTTLGSQSTALAVASVSTSPLDFGDYLPTSPFSTTGAITVQASQGITYDVGIDAGTGAGATVADRRMTSTTGPDTSTLTYGLFQDAGRALVWGNTPGVDTVKATSTGQPQRIPVYGTIVAGQWVAPGAYADTLTVTVTY